MNPDTYEEDGINEDDIDDTRQVIRTDANGLRMRMPVGVNTVDDSQNGPQLTIGPLIGLLLLAISLDTLSVLLDIVPFVGDLIEDAIGLPTLNYFLKKYEKPQNAKSRYIAIAISALIKVIPGINIIPSYTMQVIFFYIQNK